uniref:Uncharacterized protein n=1 Tax=Helicotheca tamesis TaxID=374047 RepID=A0A7S2MAA8_9STRA|mmetsp:Transcript_12583/g.17337  ORF Transcript_12583/g.17337 Transcript_12583/m.17337 type:complete len:323 (+) Transcript_12583:7-975(+)
MSLLKLKTGHYCIVAVSSILCLCNGITLDNPSLTSLNNNNNDCIPPHCPPPPPPSSDSNAHEPTSKASSTSSSPFMSPWGQLQPHHSQHYHTKQKQEQEQEEESKEAMPLVPRGGAAAIRASAQTPPPPTKQQPSSATRRRTQRRKPIINPATISLALRLTCEMNRQLTSTPKQEQSLFHTPSSSRTNKQGIERWGPSLTTYISSLLSSLQDDNNNNNNNIQNRSLVLLLSIIYLDRACSIETPRTTYHPHHESAMSSVAGGTAGHGMSGGLDHVVNGYCPPLPYITPRTVHRLITTAILLAHRAVNPSSSSSSSLSTPLFR